MLSHPRKLIVRAADENSSEKRRFLINVDATLKNLLAREDSDQNMQITIEDTGPKVCFEKHRQDKTLRRIGYIPGHSRLQRLQQV